MKIKHEIFKHGQITSQMTHENQTGSTQTWKNNITYITLKSNTKYSNIDK